jgi:hypothetical protein
LRIATTIIQSFKLAVVDDTTYKSSYFNSTCTEPVKSFKPIRTYEKTEVPLEDYTTYRLSFFNKDTTERVRCVTLSLACTTPPHPTPISL